MRQISKPSPHAFERDGLGWRVLWVLVVVLVVVLPALDLAWGEMPRHGHPCPLHANLMIAPAGVAPEEPLPSNTPLPPDSAGSLPSFAPSIFIPPRP